MAPIDRSDRIIDELINAIEELIEDMEYRRNPPGTWTGCEHMADVRRRLREAIKICLELHQK